MPLPIWYLEFKKTHGCDPSPGNITYEQKICLLKCYYISKSTAAATPVDIGDYEKLLDSIDNGCGWHNLRKELGNADERRIKKYENGELDELSELIHLSIPEGLSGFLMRKMFELGPDLLLKKMRESSELKKRQTVNWDRIIRGVIGIPGGEERLPPEFSESLQLIKRRPVPRLSLVK